MFGMSIVVSLVVLCVINIIAATYDLKAAVGTAMAALALGFLCLFFLPTVALQSLLLIVTAVICIWTQRSAKVFHFASVFATLVAYAIVGWHAWQRVQWVVDLQQEYAFESLADRLAYETDPRSDAASIMPDAGLGANSDTFSPATESRLTMIEERMPRVNEDYRSFALQRLHESVVTHFINSPGFGVTRMRYLHPGAVEPPPLESVPLPAPEPQPYTPQPADAQPSLDLVEQLEEPASANYDADLWAMHRNSVLDFVNSEGFGYVRDRENVSGFQSHGFRFLPEWEETSDVASERSAWPLIRLQLVSLLRYKHPKVYLSEHLPEMNELRDAPTRKMDRFERAGLAALASGEDLVVRQGVDRLRVLGSLRATVQCLDCHQVQRGTLLGAFSYEFRPALPREQPQRSRPQLPAAL